MAFTVSPDSRHPVHFSILSLLWVSSLALLLTHHTANNSSQCCLVFRLSPAISKGLLSKLNCLHSGIIPKLYLHFFPVMPHIFLVSLCDNFSMWCLFSLYCWFCPPKRMLALGKLGLRVLCDSSTLSSADCQAHSSLSQITVWGVSLSSLSDYHLWSNHHLLKRRFLFLSLILYKSLLL